MKMKIVLIKQHKILFNNNNSLLHWKPKSEQLRGSLFLNVLKFTDMIDRATQNSQYVSCRDYPKNIEVSRSALKYWSR